MGRLFGTDGVRGVANEVLTPELALDLALAAARVLSEAGEFTGHRPFAVVGRDPRASGEFLEAAVVAGLASAGVDVIRLGVLPTPGVAFLTASTGADFGVMLSASHNPMPDNGIKFFARGGAKLDDALEDAIEGRLGERWARPTGAAVGRVREDSALGEAYIAHLVGSLERPVSLDGITVVVDCANGAAYQTGPAAFESQGAKVIRIHAEPDGTNINLNAGSTHMDALRSAVLENGADLGIALDGDADRCLAVDATGRTVDGDQVLAVLAGALKESGQLTNDTVVATVMSNLGFFRAMEAAGITVEQTGRSLADLAAVMVRLPQVLVNVPGVDKARADTDPVLAAAVEAASTELGRTGRVLLRPSGTESLVRVMVEAETLDRADEVAQHLAGVVRDRLAL
jgi:phosphoglucosamine mutase